MVAAFLRKYIDQKLTLKNLKEKFPSPESLLQELKKTQITELNNAGKKKLILSEISADTAEALKKLGATKVLSPKL
jgi:hypothetical protein